MNGDSINSFVKAKPVFRAGLNYQIAQATYLRTSWGQGFRFPSMAEMFISTNYSGLQIFPNPELKAESGWSSEIAIKQGLKTGNWMGYFDAAAFNIGICRVKSFMKLLGLKEKQRVAYKVTTMRKHSHAIADNLLKRKFNRDRSNQAWAGDITYLRTHQGWMILFLSIERIKILPLENSNISLR